jgi:hypothetical protein
VPAVENTLFSRQRGRSLKATEYLLDTSDFCPVEFEANSDNSLRRERITAHTARHSSVIAEASAIPARQSSQLPKLRAARPRQA